MNDGIEPELCTLRYTSVDEAARRVCALGVGTQLAKFDVESAYRIVPVHPEDRPLLGMQWKERLYIDTALPFGLRSALYSPGGCIAMGAGAGGDRRAALRG